MCTSLCNKLYDSFSPSAFETDLEGAIIDYQARAAWRQRPSEKKLTAQQAVPQNMPHRPARRRACTPARERSRHRRSKLVFRSGETTPRPGAEVVPQTQPISRHPKAIKNVLYEIEARTRKAGTLQKGTGPRKGCFLPNSKTRTAIIDDSHNCLLHTPKLPSAQTKTLLCTFICITRSAGHASS